MAVFAVAAGLAHAIRDSSSSHGAEIFRSFQFMNFSCAEIFQVTAQRLFMRREIVQVTEQRSFQVLRQRHVFKSRAHIFTRRDFSSHGAEMFQFFSVHVMFKRHEILFK